MKEVSATSLPSVHCSCVASDAELAGKPLVKKSDDPSDLFHQIESQYHGHRLSYTDSLEQAQDALKKAQYEYDSAKEVLKQIAADYPYPQAAGRFICGYGQGWLCPENDRAGQAARLSGKVAGLACATIDGRQPRGCGESGQKTGRSDYLEISQ